MDSQIGLVPAGKGALAIDLPSPVPGACWRTLRQWLEEMELEFEPSINPDVGLVGYGVRMRNYLLGVGLGMRATGPLLTLTAVLCRGMDREQQALAAVDRANRQLALGQMLYLPGPPAELSFYATAPFDLVDKDGFALLFDAMIAELNNVGFPAVMAVRGYHPTDYAAPWGDPMMAPIDDDADCEPMVEVESVAAERENASDAVAGPADDREAAQAEAPPAVPVAAPPPEATADDDEEAGAETADAEAVRRRRRRRAA